MNETYCNSNYVGAPWGVLRDPGNVVVRGELGDIVIGVQQANHHVSRRAEFLRCVHLYCKKLRREKPEITTKQLLVLLKKLPPPSVAHQCILVWLELRTREMMSQVSVQPWLVCMSLLEMGSQEAFKPVYSY